MYQSINFYDAIAGRFITIVPAGCRVVLTTTEKYCIRSVLYQHSRSYRGEVENLFHRLIIPTYPVALLTEEILDKSSPN
jgi:hypothetical protein